jgi:NADP-dependent 3-hydroxy acid dehydrogenase YdfG
VEAGRVVVITGASSGVGRATARAFATRGARLGLLARGLEGLKAALAEVEQAGAEALALPTDVADPDAVDAAANAVEREYGPLDVWVNNAMVSVFSPVAEIEADEIRRVTETTYLGTVYGTLAALRRMLPRDRGVVVQVGSALAYRAYDAQQTEARVEPERPSNLWDPLPGDRGTHGIFEAEARAESIQFWLARHRALLLGAGAAAIVARRALR